MYSFKTLIEMFTISNNRFGERIARCVLITGLCGLCLTLHAGSGFENEDDSEQKNYKEGYYYTHEGKKVKGLLRHVYGSYSIFGPKENFVRFKFAPGAIPMKLTVDDISAFVIEGDTFAIARDISVSSLTHYEKDFVQVFEKGAINLFAHYSQGNGRIHINYFINTPEVPELVMVGESTKADLLNLIFDYEALYSEVKASSHWQSGIATIIEKYNRYSHKAHLTEVSRLVNSF